VGYLRTEVPIDDPNFGKVDICPCRQSEVSDRVRKRLYRFSNLDELKHLTFDTFNPEGRHNLPSHQRQSLKTALEASQNFSHNLDGWLLIQGPFGCGKTHLAAAPEAQEDPFASAAAEGHAPAGKRACKAQRFHVL